MDTRIAEKWVDALRSGKYQQGTECLKQTKNQQDKFCCLGVLTDIAIKDGLNITTSQYNSSNGVVRTMFNGDSIFLLETVKQWAGMQSNNGQFMQNDTITSLATLNDSGGLTFDEIATLIEDYNEVL